MILHPRKTDYRGNIISQIFFFWLERLLFKGFKNTLTQSDLNSCPKEQCSKELFEKFNKHWLVELKKNDPNIKIALFKTLYFMYLAAGALFLFELILFLVQGILLRNFISLCAGEDNVDGSSTGWRVSLVYACVIAIMSLFLSIMHSTAFYLIHSVGIQTRAICITAIFKKILRVQQSVLHKTSIGHIINLVSNDVFKFDQGLKFLNTFWMCPILLTVSITMVVVFIGPVGLVGICYILLHTPIQVTLAFIFGRFRYNMSVTADKRIRLMDQVIRGMRVVKFYVWEKPFV